MRLSLINWTRNLKNDSIFDIVKWVDEQIKKHTDSEVNFDLTYSAWKEVNQNRYKKR